MKRHLSAILALALAACWPAVAADTFSYTATAAPGSAPDGVDQAANPLTVWTVVLTPGGTNNNDSGADGEGVYFGNPDGGGGIGGGATGAWQEYSYQNDGAGLGGSVDAYNTFAGGALSVGQTVSINFVMRATDAAANGRPPGTVGVSLLNGSGAAVEFFIFGGGPGYYEYTDASRTNAQAGSMGYQYQSAFNLTFTVTGPNTYSALAGSDAWTGTFTGSLTGIDVFNHAGGNGSDVGFNNLAVAPELAINHVSPDDNVALFNATNTLAFSVVSPGSPVNAGGVRVVLNGADVSAGLQLTGAGSDTVGVLYTNLAPELNYTGVITVTNAAGASVSTPVRFDTFSAGDFVWEAEDFDFSSGQFIDNPVISSNSVSSYFNTVGVSNIDEYAPNSNPTNQPHGWRPNDAVSTAVAGDTARAPFQAANVPDYNVGYFNPGNWLNYTRTFPAGVYNIYARLANGNGGTADCSLAQVTSGQGTVAQTTNVLGEFLFPSRGWNAYDLVPLTDGHGNLVAVSLNGQTTLRLTSGTLGGGVNVNFFLLASGSNTPPAVVNVTPDGSLPFQTTNRLTFGVTSALSQVNAGGIRVTLNGADVSSELSISGSPTNLSVSLPLATQGVYALAITAVDAAGHTNTFAGSFDNFSQNNLMIEADEYDFNGGQFIPDPILETATNFVAANSYYTWPVGANPANVAVQGVDYTTANTNTGELFLFRYDDAAGTELTSDFLRNKFYNTGQDTAIGEAPGYTNNDFDVGWWNAGTWLNYTRVFPTNTYRVYGRLAGGSAYTNTTLDLVTAGQGTATQTTAPLGVFADAAADGFQAWHWVPLTSNGVPVTVQLGGTNTLKVTAGGAGTATLVNAHFYMFVPASGLAEFSASVAVSGSVVSISFPTANGHAYTVLASGSLHPAVWQSLGTVNGDGTVKTVTDTVAGQGRFYKVSAQ